MKYTVKIYDEDNEQVEELTIGDKAYNSIMEDYVCNNYNDNVIDQEASYQEWLQEYTSYLVTEYDEAKKLRDIETMTEYKDMIVQTTNDKMMREIYEDVC